MSKKTDTPIAEDETLQPVNESAYNTTSRIDYIDSPVLGAWEDTLKSASKDEISAEPLPGSTEACWCLLAMSGRDIGKLFRLQKEISIIGRLPEVEISLNEQSVSRAHARIIFSKDRPTRIEDLQSTNGILLNGKRVKTSELKRGDVIQVGPAAKLRFDLLDDVEMQFVSQLFASAAQDPLTGFYNKRSFIDHLTREIAWHKRHDKCLTLVLFDVDFFKKVNDTFGHLAGDTVLKQISIRSRELTRTEDLQARVGGDEFALLLRSTDLGGGMVIADRLRKSIESQPFILVSNQMSKAIAVTISLGVASPSNEQLTTPQALIEAADKCLYSAKNQGRNRVSSEP